MSEETGVLYLESVKNLFRMYKLMAEKTIAQIGDEDLNKRSSANSNSVAILVKHMNGNMLSRWTDFLSSDGEKLWRQRDEEFEGLIETKEELMQLWNNGWDCMFNAINNLQSPDLHKIIYIRKEAHSVLDAINRQLAHYSAHIGQIIFIAKELKEGEWNSLSIPKRKSPKT